MSQKIKSRSRKKSKIRTHKRLFPKLLKNNGIALDGDSLSVIRQDIEGNSVSFKVNKVVQPARILMYVNESFDWSALEKVEESLSVTTIKGENISSRGSELAKKLTNPGNNLTVEYRGTLFRNAEHAYQTWKSGEFDEAAYKSTAFKPRGSKKVNPDVNFNIMIEILTAKFEQHPDLVKEVEEVGGIEYLEQCTHNVVGDVY
jgi:hypothetical protein